MHLSRRLCLCASLALSALACTALPSRAETLTVTSSPPGATVEIDGIVAGTTPYKTDYPGGYFHKSHTAFGARLEHSITMRISKSGFISQQIMITNGPFEWVAITGRNRGNYFLLKASQFQVKLEPTSYRDTGGSAADRDDIAARQGPMRPPAGGTFDRVDRDASIGAQTGALTISSDPSNAEIYVDGQFVGQTPSTLQLAPGSHHVEMKVSGKQSWSRDLNVLSGSQLVIHGSLGAAAQF